MGLGWCCTEACVAHRSPIWEQANNIYSDQGCYVDLQSSSCGQPGAVQCTELGPGVDEACCPQYTTCAPGYNATETYVRCNIQELALKALTPSAITSMEDAIKSTDSSSISSSQSSQSSGSSSTSSSSGTTETSTTASSTNSSSSGTHAIQTTSSSPNERQGPASTIYTNAALPQETDQTRSTSAGGLATGTMVGIVVGAVAVIALLVLFSWLVWRKRRCDKGQSADNSQVYPDDKPPSAGSPGQYKGPEPYAIYSRLEMDDTRRQELWGGHASPKEMQTREVAELEGSAK